MTKERPAIRGTRETKTDQESVLVRQPFKARGLSVDAAALSKILLVQNVHSLAPCPKGSRVHLGFHCRSFCHFADEVVILEEC